MRCRLASAPRSRADEEVTTGLLLEGTLCGGFEDQVERVRRRGGMYVLPACTLFLARTAVCAHVRSRRVMVDAVGVFL